MNEDDIARQYLIEQLMCYLEIDLIAFYRKHPSLIYAFNTILKTLQPLVDDGLISMNNGIMRVEPSARQIVRVVCSAFDQYHRAELKRHTQIT